jgi:hypothetical protein
MGPRIQNLITTVQQSLWYSTLLVALALMSVVLLVLELTTAPSEETISLWQSIDLAVAYVFLFDFIIGWWGNRTYSSTRAYWRENWLNLVSSIPITNEVTSLLRFLRIFRAVKVIRVVRAGVSLSMSEQRRRERTTKQN